MSYLIGRQTIYSIISNNVLDYITSNFSENQRLKNKNISDISVPTSLISSSSLLVECGSESCEKCRLKYPDDIDLCDGLCKCSITNTSIDTSLYFKTTMSINMKDIDVNVISESVQEEMINYESSITSSTNPNWKNAIMGIIPGQGGSLLGGVSGLFSGLVNRQPEITNDIKSELTSAITSIAFEYSQSINQIITSSQDIQISGSGVKVHNVSLDMLNDITMKASINNSLNAIDSITNTFMDDIQEEISQEFSSVFQSAFDDNKQLIISGGLFIICVITLWIILVIKKSLS